MIRRLTCALGVVLTLWGGAAAAQCRQALALGVDVSGSVDVAEYDLQMRGLAAALQDPDVLRALAVLPQAPVALAIYEWSSPSYQRVIVPWQQVTTPAQAAQVAAVLRDQDRWQVPPTTGLGQALLFGKALLDQRPDCWRHTLDISADGKNNAGPDPGAVSSALGQVEVNALVVGIDPEDRISHEEIGITELTAYFQTEVIRGPAAFTEVALGYGDYARAMRRKLLRELSLPSLSHVQTPRVPPAP